MLCPRLHRRRPHLPTTGLRRPDTRRRETRRETRLRFPRTPLPSCDAAGNVCGVWPPHPHPFTPQNISVQACIPRVSSVPPPHRLVTSGCAGVFLPVTDFTISYYACARHTLAHSFSFCLFPLFHLAKHTQKGRSGYQIDTLRHGHHHHHPLPPPPLRGPFRSGLCCPVLCCAASTHSNSSRVPFISSRFLVFLISPPPPPLLPAASPLGRAFFP